MSHYIWLISVGGKYTFSNIDTYPARLQRSKYLADKWTISVQVIVHTNGQRVIRMTCSPILSDFQLRSSLTKNCWKIFWGLQRRTSMVMSHKLCQMHLYRFFHLFPGTVFCLEFPTECMLQSNFYTWNVWMWDHKTI